MTRRLMVLYGAYAGLLLAFVGWEARAQLNEHCTVSVLNRTAQVDDEGGWVLPNVPAGFGTVRARATCVENGVTRVGQSDWFSVPVDGFVRNLVIEFDAPTPVPSSLSLVAPRSTFDAIGETIQLQATATYPDGTQQDVTAGSAGTTYSTTNANVVSVTADGLLRANASGIALIGATNEGAIALLRVSVEAASDADGDGLPDDYELANGLNPNDPSDASADPDGDGLSNLDEYHSGTNPRNADTDGDGVRDGLELQTGSDPLDPTSVNLDQALTGIRLNPPTIVLVVDSIGGEASVTVTVTGDLIDGTAIDLTSRARGTTYESSDLTVANFGPTDGEIFAGNNGSAVLTVRNSGFITTAPVTVSTFTPTSLSWLSLPGYANNIDVAGNLAYIAVGSAGLRVVDITDRRAPRIIGALDTVGNANDIRLRETHALIADGVNGLVVIDVAIPSQPVLIATLDTPGTALDLALQGTTLYIADGTAGVQVVDLTTPSTPRITATLPVAGVTVRGIDIGEGLAVLATNNGIRVVDVTGTPAIVGSLPMTDAKDVRINGRTAYIADYTGSLRVVDLTTPTAPALLGSTSPTLAGYLNDLELHDEFVFGADVYFVNGVPIINVSDPANPLVRHRLDFPYRDDNGMGIAVDANYMYLVAARFSLSKPGTTGTTALYIGQYRAIQDHLGNPPSVTITNPADGFTVPEGTSFAVTVEALDDIAVNGVSLLVNGQVVGVDTTKPYTFQVQAPIGATSIVVQAQADDLGGNLGVSAPRTITVTRDTTPPTVQLLAPSNGASFANGTTMNINVSAYDPAGIERVEFLVNGLVIDTDIVAPYNMTYQLPAEPASLVVGARAYDRPGNVASASDALVTVFEDLPPSATFTIALGDDGVIFSGGEFVVTGTATDDYGVRRIDLLVDGQTVDYWSDYRTTAPFDFKYAVPAGAASARIALRVTDNVDQSVTTPEQVIPVLPTVAMSAVAVQGYARDVSVQSGFAFVAASETGVHAINVANPASPFVAATVDTPGVATALEVSGAYAFVADGTAGLTVVDVTDPLNQVLAGGIETIGAAYDVAVFADRAYVATEVGLDIIDISNPRAPSRVSRLATPHRVMSVVVNEQSAVLIYREHAIKNSDCYRCAFLAVLDLTNEHEPRILGQVSLEVGSGSALTKATIVGSTVYVASESQMFIVDVSNPVVPSVTGAYDPEFYRCCFSDIGARGSIAFTAQADYGNSVMMLSTVDPSRMGVIGTINFTAFGKYFGTGLVVTPELVYSTGIDKYPGDVRPGDVVSSHLFIGRYLTRVDEAGSAPSVALQSPQPGEEFFEHETISIRVDGSDDVAIREVTFLVDGTPVGTATAPPYEFRYTAPVGAGSLEISAAATDYAGNTTVTPTATVTVVGDAVAPTVALQSPIEGRTLPSRSVRLVANASDNFSVAIVEFYADGILVGTDTTRPYELQYTIPSGTTSVAIGVQAADPAGNRASSTNITLTLSEPALIGSISMSGNAADVAVNGTLAAVVGTGGLQLFDISDPTQPSLLGSAPTAAGPIQVQLLGQHAFVGEQGSLGDRIEIFDISNPGTPTLVSAILNERNVSVRGTNLYSTDYATVSRYDIAAIGLPRRLTQYPFGSYGFGAIDALPPYALAIDNAYGSYLRGFYWTCFCWETLVADAQLRDVRTSGNSVAAAKSTGLLVSEFTGRFPWQAHNDSFPLTSVEHTGPYILAAASDRTAVVVYDVMRPDAPTVRSLVDLSGYGAYTLGGIAATPTTALVVGRNQTGSRLFITRFLEIADTAGLTPSITLSAPGSVRATQLLPLSALATDDVGISGVTFTINGEDVFTDTVPPYEYNHLVPTGVATLAVTARATDHGNNASTSATATVLVQP